MEPYQFFVVTIDNKKIREEMEFYPGVSLIKYQASDDLDNKEAPKDSVPPGDKI